ncbi:hypothetical protein FRC19_007377 [Serendipita sp. 401]|nr:hypothetical protein FRC19_007377 [Serendipita sp. 401]KAG9057304.1 hypothetical protein FS842_007662 [Serendipita sp. 407]
MRTKRRNALKNGASNKKPRGNVGKVSINKWKRREDIVLDEEDAFHTNRDIIRLEGEENGDSEDDLQHEVFAMKSLPAQDDESVDEMEAGPDETDDGDLEEQSIPERMDGIKKTSKGKPVEDDSSSSDSEIKHESWGRKKSAYYTMNGDAVDSDDEETQKLEQAEVRRLQTEARSALEEEDFGLLDAPRIALVEEDVHIATPALSVLPEEPDALVRHLEKTSPETLALAREWEDVMYDVARSQQALQEQDTSSSSSPAVGMLQLYHQTLLTYATTLAFYLHMRASKKYAGNPKLMQTHPILARLLTLKQAMSSLERLDFGPNSDGSDDDLGSDDLDDIDDIWEGKGLADMDEDEFMELLRDAQEANAKLATENRPTAANKEAPREGPKKKKKKAPSHKETGGGEEEKQRRKEKQKKQKKKKQAFDLEEPEFVSTAKTNGTYAKQSNSIHQLPAYGEHTSLASVDAQDKSARKKSLQFHVSKIENSSAKRTKARGAAMAGDDDIPYRERDKEREIRLQKESQKRVAKLGQGGEDLEVIEDEPTPSRKKRPREDDTEDASEVGNDGYYELVKRQKKTEKDVSKAQYAAKKAEEKALREGGLEESVDGQRSLTRAILKNKGLTPTRPKTVRNPRVKKRMKFEQAKKKVRSQKAVFKGGLASTGGRYDGESSGISTKVVKSVRLG